MSENLIDPTALCLIPKPQEICLLEGVSELCADARLVTANVKPLQRKTIRSVLAAAGIRVVANKKKFVIDIQVLDADELDMSKVPESVRDDYYELDVRNNVVTVRTSTQLGALWGAQTLGWIYRTGAREQFSPNFVVRDWSSERVPGIFVDHLRGTRYMLSADWEQLMDRMSFFKMKHLAVRTFGRPPRQAVDAGELMCLPPQEEQEELAAPIVRDWFSVGNYEWQKDVLAHQVVADGMWGDLVTAANERGLAFNLVADAYGRNAYMPRVRPELAAVGEDGQPNPAAFCLSKPETRAFLDEFFSGIFARDYPKSAHPVTLDVTDTPSGAVCHCEACRASDPETLCADHLDWFASMLKEKGASEVYILDGDRATIHDRNDAALRIYPSVEDGATAEWAGPVLGLVRVDDNDPLDFVPLATFAARAWHADAKGMADAPAECVAGVFLGHERAEEFLALRTRLLALDGALVSATDVSLADVRHPDGTAANLQRIGEAVNRNAAADPPAMAAEGRALGEQAEALLTEEDRGTPAEILRTLAGLGFIGAVLADMGKALGSGDHAAARSAAEEGIAIAQRILPRWLETVYVDEFSALIAQFE